MTLHINPDPNVKFNIFVDIDGTICENRDTLRKKNNKIDYADVKPYSTRIFKINELYKKGHHITYWTGRGCVSGKDYTELTKNQLKMWGAEYHDLIVGSKPNFDFYICDKSFNSEAFFQLSKKDINLYLLTNYKKN